MFSLHCSLTRSHLLSQCQGVAWDFVEALAAENQKSGSVEVFFWSELAAADLSAIVSFGRSYGASKSGECTQLDALKEADFIFLSRAMNKNWRKTEKPEVTKKFDDSVGHLGETFSAELRAIESGQPRPPNALAHMAKMNAAGRGPGCPMGHTPSEFEMLSNLVGFLAGVGNTARRPGYAPYARLLAFVPLVH